MMSQKTPLPFKLDEITALRASLHRWGRENIRLFPWRQTTDPYQILLAEIFLHRTQVKQVAPVYAAFLSQYPNLASLLQASRENMYNMLYSLGLHWRIELLYEMVQAISVYHNGQIPRTREGLLSLPGVSQYVASALRCFAWDEPEVLLDTNTVRITGRLLGWQVKDSSRRSARFRQALEALLDRENPRAFNYALLDLAHLVCLKRQPPRCAECPLKQWCAFSRTSTEAIYEHTR